MRSLSKLFFLFLPLALCPVASLRAEIIPGKTEKSVAFQSAARDSVYSDLIAKGASASDAKEMADQMSDEEAAYFQSDPAKSQAGGFIVFLLVVTVLVLLIIFLGKRV